jgi:phosphate/sulfate permease
MANPVPIDVSAYLWIAVLGGILGFLYGFLIGANDVANAFASSVSSKSITLKQAVRTYISLSLSVFT